MTGHRLTVDMTLKVPPAIAEKVFRLLAEGAAEHQAQ
jgi:hypothetical protein